MNSRVHWTRLYETSAPEQVSWHQANPAQSLALIERAGLPFDAPVLDVGGGASHLVDQLIVAGYRDVTLLDIAEPALQQVRARMAGHPALSLVAGDVLAFRPHRQYALWHDRAVFHFLTEARDRASYHRVLAKTLAPGGHVIVATFAEDGPSRCSGLPVQRYSADALVAEFGTAFVVRATEREVHTTPTGASQHFQFVWLQAAA